MKNTAHSKNTTKKQQLRRLQPIKLFYTWMKRTSLSPAQLTFEQLLNFFQHNPLIPNQRQSVWRYLKLAYSDFPKLLLSNTLPTIAQQFIDTLQTSLRPNTCLSYTASLRRFHRFLIRKDICLEDLTRKHTTSFFLSLLDERLHPGYRVIITLNVRAYLWWLYEQQLLRARPNFLVRPADFPKIPTYLPRPLPAPLDREIQKRLEVSPLIAHKALLFMRYTGIRVGELVNLTYDSVFSDSRDIKFLKVPLGKLNKERNVPLHDRAYKLFETIQAMDPTVRPYLLSRNECLAHTLVSRLQKALHKITLGLDVDAPVTTHRLRHTYASSLLSAGASLFSIMKLLGHRDFHMTLRYAAVTQESVLKEYFAAIKTIEYADPQPSIALPSNTIPDPVSLLEQSRLALKKHASDHNLPSSIIAALLKKFLRLQLSLRDLLLLKP